MRRSKLTSKQRKCYNVLVRLSERLGRFPRISEISQEMGNLNGSTHHFINKLIAAGVLQRRAFGVYEILPLHTETADTPEPPAKDPDADRYALRLRILTKVRQFDTQQLVQSEKMLAGVL